MFSFPSMGDADAVFQLLQGLSTSAEIRSTHQSFRSSSRPWIGIPAGANLLGWSGILLIFLPTSPEISSPTITNRGH